MHVIECGDISLSFSRVGNGMMRFFMRCKNPVGTLISKPLPLSKFKEIKKNKYDCDNWQSLNLAYLNILKDIGE